MTVQTNNASTSELNGRTGIQLKNYMKASSSSSVDAELLPFEDAEPGSGGMKISSSSSLSSVHKNVFFAAVLLKVSLFGSTTFFHLSCNLRSYLRTSS